MRILGIDPGIGRTGWGVIQVNGAALHVEGFGCIETEKEMEMGQRIEKLYMELRKILEKFKPEALAIEDLYFNTNVTTAITVGQARGVILLIAQQHNLSIASYTPLQVKMGVTGYGRADKNQIGQMIKSILKLASIPKPDDTADALAIALTHAFTFKMKK